MTLIVLVERALASTARASLSTCNTVLPVSSAVMVPALLCRAMPAPSAEPESAIADEALRLPTT